MMNVKKVISLCLASLIMLSMPVFVMATEVSVGEEVDVTIAMGKKVGNKIINYDVKIPKVEGLTDLIYQENLNNILMSNAMKDIQMVEEQAEEVSKEFEQKGWEFRPYELDMNFDVRYNKDILSFVVSVSYWTGGAHGSIRMDCYNINVKENKSIDLSDLFTDDSAYIETINREISRQIKEQIASGDQFYFEGENGFQTILKDSPYYIQEGNIVQDDNLVLVFPKYSIAPGAMGIPEFSIPLTNLKDMLEDYVINEQDNKVSIFDKMTINGEDIVLNNHMYKTEENILMIPLRQVAETLGYEVTWNNDEKAAELIKGAQWAKVKIGEDNYNFAKMIVKLGVAPETKDDRTYVPVNFISEILKADISVSDEGIINIEQCK